VRILEVVEASGGGVGRHVRGLCQSLSAQNHQLTVAYAPYRTDESFERFVIDRGGRIHFVPLRIRREISPVSDLRTILQLMRLIDKEGPFDVIHGHSAKGGAIARVVGRWFGIPTVYTPHALILASPELSRLQLSVYTLVERALGHWATSKLIAVSEGERRLVLELGLVPSDRVALVENGLDDEEIEYFSAKPSLEAVRRKPLTFGSAMRFDAQKAPTNLIEAFIRLSAMLPQLPMRLVVAGDGELFAEAKRRVQISELGEKISLLGWRPDVRDVLRDLDIFVVSSLYEAGSYSIMEAMAAGLPVVSTRVSGTVETISRVPGNTLVPVGNPNALADGMKRMATLSEPNSLRRSLREIGKANRDYACAHLRQEETTRRIVEIYQTLTR
jgi:glycosyltransferase involved in cell wall biosynthesis